jgi:hypothetical protein
MQVMEDELSSIIDMPMHPFIPFPTLAEMRERR